MSDEAKNYKILIHTDAETGGIDETSAKLRGLAADLAEGGEKAEGARKGIQNMIAEAGTMREAQRLAMGLFDVIEGGGRTIQGTTELLRFFLLTAVDLNPVLLGMTVLLGSVASAMWRHADASKEAKKGTDELKDSASQFNDKLKDEIDAILAGQRNILAGDKIVMEDMKAETEELNAQVEAWNKKQKANDKYTDAKLAQKIAQNDLDKEKALQGLTGDARKDVELEYANKELGLRNQAATDKANEAVADARAEVVKAQNALAAKQKEIVEQGHLLQDANSQVQALQGKLNDLQDQQANAKNFIASNQISEGADKKLTFSMEGELGKLLREIASSESKPYDYIFGATAGEDQVAASIADLRKTINSRLELERRNPQKDPEGKARLDHDQALLAQIDEFLNIAHNSFAASKAYDDGKKQLGPEIQQAADNAAAVKDKLGQQIVDLGPLQSNVDTANTDVGTAQTNAQTTGIENQTRQQKQVNDQAEWDAEQARARVLQARKDRDDKLRMEEARNPDNAPAIKEQLAKNQQADAQADAIFYRTSHDESPRVPIRAGTPDPHQVVVPPRSAEGIPEDRAESSVHHLVNSLGGGRKIASEAQEDLKEAQAGSAQAMADLTALLADLRSHVAYMTDGQKQLFDTVFDNLRKIRDQIKAHSRQLQSVSNMGNN